MSYPTYEQLSRQTKRAGRWKDFVSAMKPGDVRELPMTEHDSHDTCRSACRYAAAKLGIPVYVRKFDGKLYAVYLMPGDEPS